MASGFPTGTVTLLFSDIEGSTQLMRRLGDDALYARVLAESQALLRGVWAEYSGVEVDTAGDGFFVAFPSAPQAVMAATGATRALATHLWPEGGALRARIGLHSGAPQLVGDKYVGMDVHRAARIAAAGHGGQVLLSDATEALARDRLPDGVTVRDLGPRRLKDLQRPERIYQLVISGLPLTLRHSKPSPASALICLSSRCRCWGARRRWRRSAPCCVATVCGSSR